jgi:transporter family-2 protein
MDHFGLFGFDEHRAGVPRMLGAALMLGGLGLIARF